MFDIPPPHLSFVERMIFILWHAVCTYGGVVTMQFNLLFAFVMALRTQRLQLAGPEQLHVTMVWCHMVSHGGSLNPANA